MSTSVVALLAPVSDSAQVTSGSDTASLTPSSAPTIPTRASRLGSSEVIEPATPAAQLPAREVEARLRAALGDLDVARKNAVMYFAEILARQLYLEFDCSSIHHYARQRLGFSRARTAYFLRLCRSFEQLPALRESVASGAVPWTKAREVVRVATPETESFWVEQALTTGRRELERRVAATRAAAKARRRSPGQEGLLVAGGVTQDGAAPRASDAGSDGLDPIVEVHVTVSFTLSPEQYARYEAMLEKARKNGLRGSRDEMFLAAWEMLTRVAPPAERVARRPQSDGPRSGGPVGEDDGRAQSGRSPEVITRGNMPVADTPPVSSNPLYQIVIRQCETCGRAEIATGRGTMPIAPKTLETALCDARVHRHGEKNKATIPPSTRREVMARDGHRCRTVGCGSARFLAVHHIVPRESGGSNDVNNLAVLCSFCHRMIHDRADGGATWPLRRPSAREGHPGDHLGDRPRDQASG